MIFGNGFGFIAISRWRAVGAALLVALPSAAGVASASDSVVEFASDDGWVFHPAVHGGEVVGLLAEQVGGQVPPNGFRIIWIEFGTSGDIAVYGWEGSNTSNAESHLIDLYDSDDLFVHADISGGPFSNPPPHPLS